MGCGGKKYAVVEGGRSLPLALVVLFLSGMLLFASGGEGKDAAASSPCRPTPADIEGPYYKPGAPARTSTGSGLVVRGRLLGIPDCRPLAGGGGEGGGGGPGGGGG